MASRTLLQQYTIGDIVIDFTKELELDLQVFFRSEPVKCIPEDGFWCYRASDAHGSEFQFSFDIFQGSVQVRIVRENSELAVFCQECANEMIVGRDCTGEYLSAYFDFGGAKAEAVIRIRPQLNIQ